MRVVHVDVFANEVLGQVTGMRAAQCPVFATWSCNRMFALRPGTQENLAHNLRPETSCKGDALLVEGGKHPKE